MALRPTSRCIFMGVRSWRFTILYDLQFSSDTQMWKEEIARLGAPCYLGFQRVLAKARLIVSPAFV